MASHAHNHNIPFAHLETIFLDVGNTLVSMDYTWIAEELAKQGVVVELDRLEREEARARPVVSRSLSNRENPSTETTSTFEIYLGAILKNLGFEEREAAAIRDQLVPVLRGPGRERLWSRVIPGVPEALKRMRSMDLKLVVVSNSDGSVERVLEGLGLAEHLSAVFDSHVVGFEKPDPRFFHHALEKSGAHPETTLHVGDLYDADVLGGRDAGIHVALIDPYDDWGDVDCLRFTELSELEAAIIERRPRGP